MSQMAGWVERRVQVDDVESIVSTAYESQKGTYSKRKITYEASATSRPEGDIVADPTLRST